MTMLTLLIICWLAVGPATLFVSGASDSDVVARNLARFHQQQQHRLAQSSSSRLLASSTNESTSSSSRSPAPSLSDGNECGPLLLSDAKGFATCCTATKAPLEAILCCETARNTLPAAYQLCEEKRQIELSRREREQKDTESSSSDDSSTVMIILLVAFGSTSLVTSLMGFIRSLLTLGRPVPTYSERLKVMMKNSMKSGILL